MSGILRISCELVQPRQVAFACRVRISGGLAGDTVDIRLWQSAGVAPLYQAVARATLDAAGEGMAHFEVALEGPCTARLVADDLSSALPLHADDIHVRVVP